MSALNALAALLAVKSEWTAAQLEELASLVLFCLGDKFVAVGEGGVILVSNSGAQWQLTESPAARSLFGIVYGAGSFVAVGDFGTVITSTEYQ